MLAAVGLPASVRCRRRADGATGRGGELAGGTLLDLAHALGAESHALADRAQPLGLAVDAVAGAQDIAFAIRQAGQQRQELLSDDRVEDSFVGVAGHRIGEQLAEAAQSAVLELDGLVERARAALGGQQVVDLVGGQAGALDELIARRAPAGVAHRVGARLLEPREMAQRAIGEHGRPGELGHQLLHRLAHPPRRVAPERHAAVGIEALEGAQQPDHALLQQLDPLDRESRAVGARDRRDERQEALDDLRPRRRVALLGAAHEALLVVRGQAARLDHVAQEAG
jgi:hypothetical protein